MSSESDLSPQQDASSLAKQPTVFETLGEQLTEIQKRFGDHGSSTESKSFFLPIDALVFGGIVAGIAVALATWKPSFVSEDEKAAGTATLDKSKWIAWTLVLGILIMTLWLFAKYAFLKKHEK